MLPVVCFVGSSRAGKTTLIENIVPEFKARGHRVAVIKHALHGFIVDKKGKDSWRFSHAGADIVVLASKDRIYLVQQLAEETPLDQIISIFKEQVDLVLVEGYKRSSWPMIEIVRSSVNSRLIQRPEELLAVVSDLQYELDIPQFFFEEVKSIINFLIEQIDKGTLNSRVDRMAANELQR